MENKKHSNDSYIVYNQENRRIGFLKFGHLVNKWCNQDPILNPSLQFLI